MRAALFSVLPVVLAGSLLATACGTRPGGSLAGSTASPTLPGSPDDLERDGVRITGMSGWTSTGRNTTISASLKFTNRESRPFTYTVIVDALSGPGEVEVNTKLTVPAVPPGRAVERTVRLEAARSVQDVAKGRVRISKVRRVPTAEAPSETGPCPRSGVRLTADDGDAAMGLRVVGLRLTNCGTRPYELKGYPLLQLLDENRKPVSGVKVFKGSGGIATVSGFDSPARPVTLRPGQSASAGLMWRNTTGLEGPAVNVPYVRVRPARQAPPIMITPELDLGTTGKLATSPWKPLTPR